MDFVRKQPLLAGVLAVVSTAVLLSIGNGMNPVWPVMWVAFLPVLVFAAETASWWMAGVAAALSILLGSLTMLYYLHWALHMPVYAWLAPYSVASLLFAVGVLLFRALLQRGAVFSAVVALPAFRRTAQRGVCRIRNCGFCLCCNWLRLQGYGASAFCWCCFRRRLRRRFLFGVRAMRVR